MPQKSAGPSQALVEPSPFRRLAALLEGVEPGRVPIDLSMGEPRHPIPDFVGPMIDEQIAAFANYPPIRGTEELRQSITGWIGRRYRGLQGVIDAERHILPLCGSREGLVSAIFPALAARKHKSPPTVLIPNPFYFSYAAAAAAAQAEPVYLTAGLDKNFLPDLEAIPTDQLERAIALYLASPSNPQGAVASPEYLETAIRLSRKHDFLLFSDECYSEIWTGSPPAGALEVAQTAYGDFANVLVFQSLSKRSNLPGLRSGFCAGDPDFIAPYGAFRNVACPQIPIPLQHVSAALWADETHVEASRALYEAKFKAADRILGDRFGYKRPSGGFFLWLDFGSHGGGEAATETLWKAYGVKVLPGAYLARPEDGGVNPGWAYVRLALVGDLAASEEALQRIVEWAESG